MLVTLTLLIGALWLYINHAHEETSAENAAAIRNSLSALNKKAPLLVNPKLDLYLIKGSYEVGSGVIYEYRFFKRKKSDMSSKELVARKLEFTASYCMNDYKYAFSAVGGVQFRYLSQDGMELFTLKPHPSDCPKQNP